VYSGGMIKTYTLEEPKPEFKYGENVAVDMAHLGGSGVLLGKIVGRGMVHVIDMWMVEFATDFGSSYPYRVAMIPHTAIIRSMPLDKLIATLKQ